MPTTKADITQFIAWGTIMFSLLGIFMTLFVFYYRNRHQNFHKKEELFQQTLLHTQLEIREQTMKNISQEIHDNVGQLLSLAKLHLATTENAGPNEKDDKIKSSKDLVSKAIKDLRNLSHSLDTDYIGETGLLKVIEAELVMIEKSGQYNTEFHVEGNPFPLEGKKELITFRIVQEMLNNIIKHAKAKMIKVQMVYRVGYLLLEISDDGEGFDLSPLNDAGNTSFGLGIRNMSSRAHLIGAEFNISSTLGNGTIATISIPQ